MLLLLLPSLPLCHIFVSDWCEFVQLTVHWQWVCYVLCASVCLSRCVQMRGGICICKSVSLCVGGSNRFIGENAIEHIGYGKITQNIKGKKSFEVQFALCGNKKKSSISRWLFFSQRINKNENDERERWDGLGRWKGVVAWIGFSHNIIHTLFLHWCRFGCSGSNALLIKKTINGT